MSAIVTRLKFEVYLAGDAIIHEGDLGLEMYFLKEGTVHVVRQGRVAIILRDGDYFGGESQSFLSFFFEICCCCSLFPNSISKSQ